MQVIFRKRATNYRALLRKMTCKDKASYDATPPCTAHLYVCVLVGCVCVCVLIECAYVYVCVCAMSLLYWKRDPRVISEQMYHELSLSLQHTATHCNTLQHQCIMDCRSHCNTLQHTATHCNTLQHTAVCCSELQCVAVCCSVLQCVIVCSQT